MRRVILRLVSATASTAILSLPAAGQDQSGVKPDPLPPVTVSAPDAKPTSRNARRLPSRDLGKRNAVATRSSQPNLSADSSLAQGMTADGAATMQPTAASAVRFTGAEVNAVPFSRLGEALEVVPGLIVTQHSGEGKANQYFLRGFNLDHGTDLDISVDGMPVNMRTHGHGQGYADINFLIPELIQSVNVRKGPYFADVGDFGSAGAVGIDYVDRLPKNLAEVTFGSFGYPPCESGSSHPRGRP